MSETLPQVGLEHLERLLGHVDGMPAIADGLLTAASDDARRAVAELSAFLVGTLVPHVDASETALYPELERLFQNRHSMAPMRREHDEIRRLVSALAEIAETVAAGPLTIGRTLAVRRVLFNLYALLKIHLIEEEAYLRIIEKGVSADEAVGLAAALDHRVIWAT